MSIENSHISESGHSLSASAVQQIHSIFLEFYNTFKMQILQGDEALSAKYHDRYVQRFLVADNGNIESKRFESGDQCSNNRSEAREFVDDLDTSSSSRKPPLIKETDLSKNLRDKESGTQASLLNGDKKRGTRRLKRKQVPGNIDSAANRNRTSQYTFESMRSRKLPMFSPEPEDTNTIAEANMNRRQKNVPKQKSRINHEQVINDSESSSPIFSSSQEISPSDIPCFIIVEYKKSKKKLKLRRKRSHKKINMDLLWATHWLLKRNQRTRPTQVQLPRKPFLLRNLRRIS
ncbi:hypothetical protein V1511DRAFT_511758 [Dipodascopsis uninucleata]